MKERNIKKYNKQILFSQQAGLGRILAGFAKALASAPNLKRYVPTGISVS
jgi:hypothetical protein